MQSRSWMATLVLAAGSSVLLGLPVRAQQTGSDQGQAKAETAGSAEGPGGRRRPQASRRRVLRTTRGAQSPDRRPGSGWVRGRDQAGEPGLAASSLRATHVGAYRQRKLRVPRRRGPRRRSLLLLRRSPCASRDRLPRPSTAGSAIALEADARQRSPTGAQSFTCYMNSPSKLAGLERTDRTRR